MQIEINKIPRITITKTEPNSIMPKEFTVKFIGNESWSGLSAVLFIVHVVLFIGNESISLFYTFVIQEKLVNTTNIYEHSTNGIKLMNQTDQVKISITVYRF